MKSHRTWLWVLGEEGFSCGGSSVGRTSPCQGEGRRFESASPLKMAESKLENYIKEQRQKKVSDSKIKSDLVGVGWEESDVASAFAIIDGRDVPTLTNFASAGELLRQSWRILKARIKTLLAISAIGFAAQIIFGLLILLLVGVFGFGPYVLTNASALVKIVSFVLVFAIGVAVFLAFLYTQVVVQIALIAAILNRASAVGFKQAFRSAKGKVVKFWLVGFLAAIAAVGGYFLLIVPGIILAIYFSLAVYIYLSEGIGGLNALIKSWQYTRGRVLSLIWRMLVIGCVLGAVYILSLLLTGLSESIDSGLFQVVVFFVNLIIYLGLGYFASIYFVLIYENLKSLRGDFEFVPTKKQRTWTVIAVIWGIIAIPLLVVVTLSIILSATTRLHNSNDQYYGRYDSGSNLLLEDNPYYYTN